LNLFSGHLRTLLEESCSYSPDLHKLESINFSNYFFNHGIFEVYFEKMAYKMNFPQNGVGIITAEENVTKYSQIISSISVLLHFEIDFTTEMD